MKRSVPVRISALLLLAVTVFSVFLWLNTESLFHQMQDTGAAEQLRRDWESRTNALKRLVFPLQALACWLFILSSVRWLFERRGAYKKSFGIVLLTILASGLILLTAIPLSGGSIGLTDVLNGPPFPAGNNLDISGVNDMRGDSMRRKIMIPVLAALLLFVGCGGRQTVTITAVYDPETGPRSVGALTVADNPDFKEPMQAQLQSRSGQTATYTVTVPGKVKILYWQPIISRVNEPLEEPVEALMGPDETAALQLDGADWLTVEPGTDPQSGRRCLVVRTVPGSRYISGAGYVLIKPNGYELTGELSQREPSNDRLDVEEAVGYIRFSAMDEPGVFAGCTLRVTEGRYASDAYQPALTSDDVELIMTKDLR